MPNPISTKIGNLEFNKTLIMGVLNITPDSFSDGGKYINPKEAISHAKQMIKEGADIIDIGGESSRPGADEVSIKEELKRVQPVIEALVKEIQVPISIDTYKPEVADICLEKGASIVNDISGLRNEEMLKIIAKHNVPAIIMHMQGTPRNMQNDPKYENTIQEIKQYLKQQIETAKNAGINQLIIDPGIGFGKTVRHNLEIIKNLEELSELNVPILFGASKKSFIGKINNTTENERVEGTIAANTAAILNGANIIRVHDVKECKKAAEIADAIKNPNSFE